MFLLHQVKSEASLKRCYVANIKFMAKCKELLAQFPSYTNVTIFQELPGIFLFG